MKHLFTILCSSYKQYDELVGFEEKPDYEIEREDRKPSKSQSKLSKTRIYACASLEYLERIEADLISQGYP